MDGDIGSRGRHKTRSQIENSYRPANSWIKKELSRPTHGRMSGFVHIYKLMHNRPIIDEEVC